MIKSLILAGLFLLLSACDRSLNQLTPIDAFSAYILADMDASVEAHLNELVEAIKQHEGSDQTQQFNAWLQLAHAMHGYELFNGAELAYQNTLLFDQGKSSVEYQLAHLYRLQGKYQLSNQLFKSVIQEAEDYAPAYNNLAENLYDQGLLSEAKEAIKSSLEVDAKSAYALQILANIDGQLNHTEAAVDALQKALQLQPGATKLYANLAQLYQQMGQTDAAENARTKAGDGTLATSDPWLSEVTSDLRGFNQFFTKAQMFVNKQDYKNAMIWAEQAAADRPDGFTTQMLLGVLKVRLGEPNQALLDFRKAYLQRPNDYKVNLNLGTVYKQLGNYQKSIEYFSRAEELDSTQMSAKINLADVYCINNQYTQGMELVSQLKTTTQLQGALYVGLKCQILNKRFNQAYQWVKDNIESVKNNDAFIEYAILLLATTPIDEHRNGQTALTWAQRLVQKQPTNKRKQLMVMALMQVNQFEQAQNILNSMQPSKDLFIPKQSLQQLLIQKVPFIMNAY